MMSALGWRAMRNSIVICRRLFLISLVTIVPLGAEEQGDTSGDIAPPRATDHAEYHSQSLPNDMFIPSEGVVEDYPVAFPVDI